MKKTLNKKSLFVLPLLILPFIASLGFYFYAGHMSGIVDIQSLNFIINIHDHNIYYKKSLTLMSSGDFKYELNNDFGIALIYYFLYLKTGLFKYFSITEVSFFVNFVVFIMFVFFYLAVCSEFKLGYYPRIIVFFNLNFIYFLQLINKDMFTLMIISAYFYFSIKNRYLLLILIIPFAFLIRQQLALCLLTFSFLMYVKNTRFWMLMAYTISAVAAGIISAFLSIISMESMGEGFSAYILQFNQNYYLGYLLFNPIRFLFFIGTIPQSLLTLFSSNSFDFSALFRVTLIFFYPLILIFIYRSLRWNNFYIKSECKAIIILVFSFFICWLMNPTINARYLLLIVPFMILGYYIQKKLLLLSKDE